VIHRAFRGTNREAGCHAPEQAAAQDFRPNAAGDPIDAVVVLELL